MTALDKILIAAMKSKESTASVDRLFSYLDAKAEAAEDLPDGAYFEVLRESAKYFIDHHKLPFDEYDAVAAWIEDRNSGKEGLCDSTR